MYSVDEYDTVAGIEEAPLPCPGAPLPTVIATDLSLSLVYYMNEPDPSWDGNWIRLVTPTTSNLLVATVSFVNVCAHMFGPPNDEALEGHPLYKRGLDLHSISEVKDSSWIRGLERVNTVHPLHRSSYFKDYRHFVFAFKDITFECVAEGLEVDVGRGALHEAVSAVVAELDD